MGRLKIESNIEQRTESHGQEGFACHDGYVPMPLATKVERKMRHPFESVDLHFLLLPWEAVKHRSLQQFRGLETSCCMKKVPEPLYC